MFAPIRFFENSEYVRMVKFEMPSRRLTGYKKYTGKYNRMPLVPRACQRLSLVFLRSATRNNFSLTACTIKRVSMIPYNTFQIPTETYRSK